MSRIETTYCRNCPSLCGMHLEIEDNKVVDIKGDADNPLTAGYMCVKGQASKDWQNGEDRNFNHLARGANGEHEAVSFEQGISDVSDKLKAIIDKHGPGAIGLYYGTGTNNHSLTGAVMKGFMAALGSPYVFSSMTIDQSSKWVTACRMGMFPTGKYNTLDADVVMISGGNPLISHASGAMPVTAPRRWMIEAKKRDVKLIVIDPRRTETARQADIHVQVDPGTDAFFFSGLIRIALENGWHDQAFCERFVDGMDALATAVSPFTPDLVAKRCGITEGELTEVAEVFAKAGKKAVHTGTGSNMCPHANTVDHLTEALNAICGGYRTAGDAQFNLRSISGNPITQEMVIPPMRHWEYEPKLKSTDTGMLFGEFPTSLLPKELSHSGDDRIRALICIGGNLLQAIPDPETAHAAFQDLELTITIDPRNTKTVRASDYVFSTSLPYERYDVSAVYDGICAHPYANAVRPALERPQGIVDDWEVFYEIAKRLNLDLKIKIPTFGANFEQTQGPVYEFDMVSEPTTKDILTWICSHGETSFDELADSPGGIHFENLSATVAPADESMRSKLDLMPSDVASEIEQVLAKDASSAPYTLINRRMLDAMNSSYSRSRRARKRWSVNPTFMHPEDMAEADIEEGDRVAITSEHGSVQGHAKPDRSLKRGVISISHCWGEISESKDPTAREGTNVNLLLSHSDGLESYNYMPTMTAVPVEVSAIPDAAS